MGIEGDWFGIRVDIRGGVSGIEEIGWLGEADDTFKAWDVGDD